MKTRMISFLKEQEERIRKEMELPDSAKEKMFDNLGFLDGLYDYELRRKVVFCMYEAYKFLFELDQTCSLFEAIVLPLTRRILTSEEYDGHLLKRDELYLFMKEKKVSDLKNFLVSMRTHPYARLENHEYLSNVHAHDLFGITTYLYGVDDKTLLDAINEYREHIDNLTDREKHILNNIIRLDFEAEMTGLTAEYFVFLHQK
jgi:hypothetical protein